MWLSIVKHLLPRGKAWSLTIDKNLRRFFDGLMSALGAPAKSFFDQVWQEINPLTTSQLNEWETQWGLTNVDITEQQRRERLSAAWQSFGGQSPRYIQDTLRANGFDVYVHEWWETPLTLGVDGCAIPRNPLQFLRRQSSGIVSQVECDEPLALCGEDFAIAGNSLEPKGYPLVNQTLRTVADIIVLCGEEFIEAGESNVLCGNYNQFTTQLENYIIPLDTQKWSYFLYIGAQNIQDVATIPLERRDEFEALCLKICPTHLWLGILVDYI